MRYLFALIVVVLIPFIFAINGEKNDMRVFSVKAHSYIEGLKIVDKKNGTETWVISAKRADFTEDERFAKMDSVTITIVKEGIMVHALKGSYDFLSKVLWLQDGVTMDYRDSVLTAGEISMDIHNRRLTSEGVVCMKGKKFRIEGEGLSANDEQKVSLSRNVRAIFF